MYIYPKPSFFNKTQLIKPKGSFSTFSRPERAASPSSNTPPSSTAKHKTSTSSPPSYSPSAWPFSGFTYLSSNAFWVLVRCRWSISFCRRRLGWGFWRWMRGGSGWLGGGVGGGLRGVLGRGGWVGREGGGGWVDWLNEWGVKCEM